MSEQCIFKSQSLSDWLFYLESQHNKEIDLGLERVLTVAENASVKDLHAGKVVLVAGTNGKGTTIRFMEQYLLGLGKTVGVYSSPHMFEYNERVRINGSSASDQDLIDSFSFIEQHRKGTSLSYFEFGTLAGFKLLQSKQLDYVLVEVGLGGRLDATNILEHDVSVVTSIGLDHIDWLGDTIEKIGFEKAGVFRKDKPAVVGEPKHIESIAQQAKNHQVSEFVQFGQDYSFELNTSLLENTWDFVYDDIRFNKLPNVLIPKQNICTSLVTLIKLGVTLEQGNIEQTLSQLSLPGRMQIVSTEPLQMVDVAHNPHAVEYLRSMVLADNQLKSVSSVTAVIAMMKDKDIKQTLSLMIDVVDEWVLGDLVGNPRAAKKEDISEILKSLGQNNVTMLPSVKLAWLYANENQNKDSLLLGFGSFYTVAEILNKEED
ncbi:bifunctional tetrahydrofolate synthase/dihydrofolate synthase [uncultured Psychrosphaera sp.]|uniref:bifunctional tetrahydrofolate synthase/dihydrofolate synthase n=1 Tax=uncultured Psychrosphaera sp. TaxID=1403522 RepID=UPI002634356E|nr:bifunctional tetrahydrofolate synthase/dihydrofolate synthase [uncultured Psychrosphaera sp.]